MLELANLNKRVQSSKEFRMELARQSLAYFTFIYLPHYIKSEVPTFHWEIYEYLQESGSGLSEIVAFRGSAKSTIASLALPLWSALFNKRKFIIVISDTNTQAKQIISNIIYELENNEIIRNDFGSLKTKSEDWAATNILLSNEVRIMSRSRGQRMRGLRHMQYRPDLIICDDIENIDAVRTKEGRDKTEEWFFSDCLPCIDSKVGKMVVLGNLLHEDSFVCRLKKKIPMLADAFYREFPLIDADGNNLWPQEYPADKVEDIRKRGNTFFMREYCLKILPQEDQLIKRVGFYDELPTIKRIAIAADLAISQSDSADRTAINVAGEGEGKKIYNMRTHAGRWNFNEALNNIHGMYQQIKIAYPGTNIILGIEDVAYQKAAIEEFKRRFGISVKAIKQTKDKRARLEVFVPYLENDQILFPREGQEDTIQEALDFGSAKHDDRIDAAEMSWRLLIDTPSIGMAWG